eukprot:14610303-Alexandrium_andersonii.AAC.1
MASPGSKGSRATGKTESRGSAEPGAPLGEAQVEGQGAPAPRCAAEQPRHGEKDAQRHGGGARGAGEKRLAAPSSRAAPQGPTTPPL